jgi:hypothetical protein
VIEFSFVVVEVALGVIAAGCFALSISSVWAPFGGALHVGFGDRQGGLGAFDLLVFHVHLALGHGNIILGIDLGLLGLGHFLAGGIDARPVFGGQSRHVRIGNRAVDMVKAAHQGQTEGEDGGEGSTRVRVSHQQLPVISLPAPWG